MKCEIDPRESDSVPVILKPGDTKNTIKMIAQRADTGSIEAVIPGRIEGTVAFDPRYLTEFFAGTNAGTMFGMDSLKPWGVEEEADYCSGAKRTRLIMPVRA